MFFAAHFNPHRLPEDRRAVLKDLIPLLLELFIGGIYFYVNFASFLTRIGLTADHIKALTISMLEMFTDIHLLAKTKKNINFCDANGILTYLVYIDPDAVFNLILGFIETVKGVDPTIYIEELKQLITDSFTQVNEKDPPDDNIHNWLYTFNYNPNGSENNSEIAVEVITVNTAELTDGSIVENNSENNDEVITADTAELTDGSIVENNSKNTDEAMDINVDEIISDATDLIIENVNLFGSAEWFDESSNSGLIFGEDVPEINFVEDNPGSNSDDDGSGTSQFPGEWFDESSNSGLNFGEDVPEINFVEDNPGSNSDDDGSGTSQFPGEWFDESSNSGLIFGEDVPEINFVEDNSWF